MKISPERYAREVLDALPEKERELRLRELDALLVEELRELRTSVASALDKILPDRKAYIDRLEPVFEAWKSGPAYAIHRGLPTLLAEFYIRTRNPELRGQDFYRIRNALLDCLEAEFSDLRGLRELDGQRLQVLAPKIRSVFDALSRESNPEKA